MPTGEMGTETAGKAEKHGRQARQKAKRGKKNSSFQVRSILAFPSLSATQITYSIELKKNPPK